VGPIFFEDDKQNDALSLGKRELLSKTSPRLIKRDIRKKRSRLSRIHQRPFISKTVKQEREQDRLKKKTGGGKEKEIQMEGFYLATQKPKLLKTEGGDYRRQKMKMGRRVVVMGDSERAKRGKASKRSNTKNRREESKTSGGGCCQIIL